MANSRSEFFHSLRFRLVALPLLMVVLLASSVTFNSNRVVRDAMLENIRSSVLQTSQILNIAVAPYASNGNLAVLGAFLAELLFENKNIGLTYIAVIREDGNALLQVGQVGDLLPEPDLAEQFAKAVDSGEVHIRQPILLRNNEIGFLQYGLSSRVFLEAARRINTEGGVLIGLGLFIAAAISFALGLHLTRRINGLVEAAEAVAFGDYSRKVQVNGSDEIALLASHFNLMARSIQLRIADISELNLGLENRVRERTEALEHSNQSLQETIANLNETRDSLVRSEKMASLGGLVAGVSHELNTPIGNALSVASSLHEKVREFATEYSTGLRRATLEDHLKAESWATDLIVRNLARASELVTSFKQVAVDQASEQRRKFKLDEVIREVITTLQPSIRKTPYRIEQRDVPDVLMNSYPGPLGQVIANLVNNAVVHAFEGRPQGCITIAGTLDGDGVCLNFSDDGCGIEPEIVNRIFDPFFTTRMGRGGTGLGLSIVLTLVETVLGGSLAITSNPGQGTSFQIRLPLFPDSAEGKV